jgi:membrane associated rhomboid family serine protease
MGMLAEPMAGPRRLCAGLALGAPLISLGLLLCVPDLFEYRGASGMATMVSVLAGFLLWPAAGNTFKAVLACGAAGFAVKPLFDVHASGFGFAALPVDVAVAWQAHLLGAACGVALALAVRRILLAKDYAHDKLPLPPEPNHHRG